MPGHDIIVMGASAGGVEALMEVVRALPRHLPAALFVVLHIPPDGASALPQILANVGPLPAVHPRDGDPIEHGRIYIAPPDHHLLVEPGHVRLTRGPRENRYRPAVDPLFRSAARAYGPRVIGVVLSGMLDDGSAGMIAIASRGGVGVVQEPQDALFPGMPQSAIKNDSPAHIVPVAAIGPLLVRLAREPVHAAAREVPKEMDKDVNSAEFDLGAIEDRDKPGTPSVFGCPECGGVLWEMQEGTMLRYRCRVGHAFTADSLIAEQSTHLEAALWAALRGLEEKAALVHRLAERARAQGHATLVGRYTEQEQDARQHARVLRDLILRGETSPADTTAAYVQETGEG
jgi:two-component system chemotaxis response regulator CheB